VKKARDALPRGIRALWPEPDQTARSAIADELARGPPGPSQRDPVEGSRDTIEHELERAGAEPERKTRRKRGGE